MSEVSVTLEIRPWQRAMNSLGKDQLPFAVASTLSKVAVDAQHAVRRELPKRFTLRSNWTQRGILTTPAKKRDWPRITAVVGSRDEFLVQHETGGVFRPRRSKFHAIPTKRVQRKASGAVRKAQTPRALIERGRGYFAGRSIKLSDTRRTKQQAGTMFFLRPTVRIRPVLGFESTVRETAHARLQSTFRSQLSAALRSRATP